MSTQVRFSIHDFDHLPEDNSKRYEIIDGELYVSTAPDIDHQAVSFRIAYALQQWNDRMRSGFTVVNPGVIFADDNAVVPDVIWISRERNERYLGDDRKLRGAPELVVEVLSPGSANQARDLQFKRKLYSRQDVSEYWIVDWREATIRVYRRENAVLQLAATLSAEDSLESPLLPGFSLRVGELCAPFG
jgi:Uma2 family endonuclease